MIRVIGLLLFFLTSLSSSIAQGQQRWLEIGTDEFQIQFPEDPRQIPGPPPRMEATDGKVNYMLIRATGSFGLNSLLSNVERMKRDGSYLRHRSWQNGGLAFLEIVQSTGIINQYFVLDGATLYRLVASLNGDLTTVEQRSPGFFGSFKLKGKYAQAQANGSAVASLSTVTGAMLNRPVQSASVASGGSPRGSPTPNMSAERVLADRSASSGSNVASARPTAPPPVNSKTEAARRFYAGVEFIKQGKLEEAIVRFESGLLLDPDSAPGHLWLGITYGTLRNFSEANRHLRRVIELDLGSSEAARARVALGG